MEMDTDVVVSFSHAPPRYKYSAVSITAYSMRDSYINNKNNNIIIIIIGVVITIITIVVIVIIIMIIIITSSSSSSSRSSSSSISLLVLLFDSHNHMCLRNSKDPDQPTKTCTLVREFSIINYQI